MASVAEGKKYETELLYTWQEKLALLDMLSFQWLLSPVHVGGQWCTVANC